MAKLHFELVAPDKLIFSGEVDQVDVPGSEGDFGVLAGHAPLVAMLRPGILTIHTNGEKQRVVVHGGFAEASPAGLTILADVATAIEDIDTAALASHIKSIEEKTAQMEQGSLLDKEIWRLDHFKSVHQQIVGTAMH